VKGEDHSDGDLTVFSLSSPRSEPEAGAIHASSLATLHHLRPSQCFLLCDAGGGTVDSGVYKLMGQLSELEIAEMCVRSGANTGSLFVDLKFEELLRRMCVALFSLPLPFPSSPATGIDGCNERPTDSRITLFTSNRLRWRRSFMPLLRATSSLTTARSRTTVRLFSLFSLSFQS
jgi:hypothetical protein